MMVTVGEIAAPGFFYDGHCWRIRGPSVGLTQPITTGVTACPWPQSFLCDDRRARRSDSGQGQRVAF